MATLPPCELTCGCCRVLSSPADCVVSLPAPVPDDLSGVKLEPEEADTELSRAIQRSPRLRQEAEAQVRLQNHITFTAAPLLYPWLAFTAAPPL